MGVLMHESSLVRPEKKRVIPKKPKTGTEHKVVDFPSKKPKKKNETKVVEKRVGKKQIKKRKVKKISAKYKTPTHVLVDKILQFCMILTGRTLFPYQINFAKRIIRAVITNDNQEMTALFARQSGKSETVSVVISGLMVILPTLANTPAFYHDERFIKFRSGIWIGNFAPSQRQTGFVFGRVRSFLQGTATCQTDASRAILEELGVEFSTNNGENIVISTSVWSSRVTCITASDNANIEGESLHFILCDESQDISDFVLEKSIFPMGSFYNASTVLIGTPNTRKGYFYNAIERNVKKYKKSGGRIKNHYEYDWRTIIKYNPNYSKFVDKEREKGENRDEFRMAYNLEWILNREMFLTEAVLQDKVWDEELSFVPSDLVNTHVVGIDLGKSQDDTVVTVVEPDWMSPVVHQVAQRTQDGGFNEQYTVYKFKVKDVLRIEGDDWEDQYHMIVSYLRNFKVARIVMDATSVGSPIYDRLRIELPHIEVVPYVFGSASKSDLYKHFITELSAGRIKYPHHESITQDARIRDFHEQAVNMEKFYRGSYLVCQHPDKRGAKDDFIDSLALACWAVKGAVQIVKTDTVSKRQVIKTTKRQEVRSSRTSRRRGGTGRDKNIFGTPVAQYVHAYGLAVGN